MKRTTSVFALICLILCLCGCSERDVTNQKSFSEDELYDIGLTLIDTMDEMVKSEAYTGIVGGASLSSDDIDTGEHSTPAAVYSVSTPDTETMLTLYSTGQSDNWHELSDNLKAQLSNRFSFSTVAGLINGRAGTAYMAYSSVYLATDKIKGLTLDEDKHYLYTYDDAAAVAVTFSSGRATGQFVFLDGDAEELLSSYKCTVKKISQ